MSVAPPLRVWPAALLALLTACASAPSGPPLSPAVPAFDLSFDASPGCVPGPPSVRLVAGAGEVTLTGSVATGDSCPLLSARAGFAQGHIRLEIETREPRAPCGPCPGAVGFAARLKGVAPDLYTVRVLVDGLEVDRQGVYVR
ncbi:MAG: hypothetical protein QXO51_01815 [Halobacteria archaeon]